MRVLSSSVLELHRGRVLQAAVRAHLVVVVSPDFNQEDGFSVLSEPLDGQTFFKELAIEALAGAVLPRVVGSVE